MKIIKLALIKTKKQNGKSSKFEKLVYSILQQFRSAARAVDAASFPFNANQRN